MARNNIVYVSKVRQLCNEANLSPYDLAAKAGTTPQTVYACIKDIKEKPLATLHVLAVALGKNIEDLFTLAEDGNGAGAA